jgi:hypothetical protein
VAERVGEPPEPPAVALADREDLGRAGRQRPREEGVGVGDGEDHPDWAAAGADGIGAPTLRCLAADPELGAVDGQSCHHAASRIVQAIDLDRAERPTVEVEGQPAVADRQPRGNGGVDAGIG